MENPAEETTVRPNHNPKTRLDRPVLRRGETRVGSWSSRSEPRRVLERRKPSSAPARATDSRLAGKGDPQSSAARITGARANQKNRAGRPNLNPVHEKEQPGILSHASQTISLASSNRQLSAALRFLLFYCRKLLRDFSQRLPETFPHGGSAMGSWNEGARGQRTEGIISSPSPV